MLDEAQVVQATDGGKKAAYWRAQNGDIWFCVVKVTQMGELFFVSYRQESEKTLKKILTQAELERLGVAWRARVPQPPGSNHGSQTLTRSGTGYRP